jgi:uncharacterized protein YkvS
MRFNRKLPSFIFGVSIGLIIGIAFFVFKINDLFDKLKSSAAEKITVIEQPMNKPNETKKEKNKKGKERFKISGIKSSKASYNKPDSLFEAEAELMIATDEILKVKTIKIIRIGNSTEGKDSLASKLAQVNDVISDMYFIEFWKTPLNSKGYRFSKNKILLYGFVDFNDVLLYELDDSYYLKSSDQVFKLFYGSDFKKLELVLDTDLLAKIN